MMIRIYTLAMDDDAGTNSVVFATEVERDHAFLGIFDDLTIEDERKFWMGEIDHHDIVEKHADMFDTYNWDHFDIHLPLWRIVFDTVMSHVTRINTTVMMIARRLRRRA